MTQCSLDDRELLQEIRKRGYDVSKAQLGALTSTLELHDPYGKEDLREILQHLEKMGVDVRRPHTGLDVAKKKVELLSDREYDWYEGDARNIRQYYFRGPEPPFSSMAEADEWILSHAEQQEDGMVLGHLEYVAHNGVLREIEVREGSHLAKLWRDVKGIGWSTRLNRAPPCDHRVLAFILTGERIPASFYGYSWGPGMEFTITIRSPDVPVEFITKLASALREATFGPQGPSRQSPEGVERAYRLIEFVDWNKSLKKSLEWLDRFDGKKRERPTWETWRREWNSLHPDWAFDNCDAMRGAYSRAKKAHWHSL